MFDSSGKFDLFVNTKPTGYSYCTFVMAQYGSSGVTFVKKTDVDCNTVSFNSSDTPSPITPFEYGQTYKFSVTALSSTGEQICGVQYKITECNNGGLSRAYVNPLYSGYGDFIVTGSAFPQMGINDVCQYELVVYGDAKLLSDGYSLYRVNCNDILQGVFTHGSGGVIADRTFSFSGSPSFVFRRRHINNSLDPICYSATQTITPTQCAGGAFLWQGYAYYNNGDLWADIQGLALPQGVCNFGFYHATPIPTITWLSSGTACSDGVFSNLNQVPSIQTYPISTYIQVLNSDNITQNCVVTTSPGVSRCSTSAAFFIGTIFDGDFYISADAASIGYQANQGQSCWIELVMFNGVYINPISVQIPLCESVTFTAADYASAGTLGDGSKIRLRLTLKDSSGNVLCMTPYKYFTYSKCTDSAAVTTGLQGWVSSTTSLSVSYMNHPIDSIYACVIEAIKLDGSHSFSSVSGCSSAATFSFPAYSTLGNDFWFQMQMQNPQQSDWIACSTPMHKLTNSRCLTSPNSLSAAAYDDLGTFNISLVSADIGVPNGASCTFGFVSNNGTTVAPINRVTDGNCLGASFTNVSSFALGNTYKFKYMRLGGTYSEIEYCSENLSITTASCKSNALTTTTISAYHDSSGAFVVSAKNPPSNGLCTYTIIEYGSAGGPYTILKSQSCSSAATFYAPATYEAGRAYDLRISFTSEGSSIQTCSTAHLRYVDCASGVAPIKSYYTYEGDFNIWPSNVPTLTEGAKCRFEFLKYNGFNLTDDVGYIDSSSCSLASFYNGISVLAGAGTFAIGNQQIFRLRVVNSAGTTTQCYSTATILTTATCGGGLALSATFDTSRTFAVAVENGPDADAADCQIGITQYRSDLSGTFGKNVTRTGNNACTSGTFAATDLSLTAITDGSYNYRFSFQQFDKTTGLQTCASTSLKIKDCASTGYMDVNYNGDGAFRVTTVPATVPSPTLYWCFLYATTYAGYTLSQPYQMGPCSSDTPAIVTSSTSGKSFTYDSTYVFTTKWIRKSDSTDYCFAPLITVTTRECKSGSTSTSLSINYRANGNFLVSVFNAPSTAVTGNCVIRMTDYGPYAIDWSTQNSCISAVTFTKPSVNEFIIGNAYKFTFFMTDGGTTDHGSQTCSMTPASKMITQCTESFTMHWYPFDRMLVVPSGFSSGSACAAFTRTWGSVDPNAPLQYTAGSCTLPFVVSGNGAGIYNAILGKYASGVTDFSNTEPTCITDVVSGIWASDCLTSPAISLYDEAFNQISVQYLDSSVASYDCALFVKTWNLYGANMTSTSVAYFEDPACSLSSQKIITTSDMITLLGTSISFSDLGSYAIQYARYTAPLAAGASLTTVPDCKSPTITTFTPTVSACSASSYTFERLDAQTVRAKLNCVARYGYASIALEQYTLGAGHTGTTITQTLPLNSTIQVCDSNVYYDFTYSSTGNVPYYTGDTMKVAMSYFGDSTASTWACTSTQTTYVIAAYTAIPNFLASRSDETKEFYQFSLDRTTPINGDCRLMYTCDGSVQGGLRWPSNGDCNGVLSNVEYYQLYGGLYDKTKTIPYGASCVFSYNYTSTQPSPSSTMTSSNSVTLTSVQPKQCQSTSGATTTDVTITEWLWYDQSITVKLSSIPDGGSCYIYVYNWASLTPLSTPVYTACTSALSYSVSKPPGGGTNYYTSSTSTQYPFKFRLVQNGTSETAMDTYCITPVSTYIAPLCELSAGNPTIPAITKYPFGRLRVTMTSIQSNMAYCNFYFLKWKTSQVYLESNDLTTCSSVHYFDAGGYNFDYTNNQYDLNVIGYTGIVDQTAVPPLCGTSLLATYSAPKCAVTISAKMVGYQRIQVTRARTSGSDAGKCVFFVYQWSGTSTFTNPGSLPGTIALLDTTDCTTGVTFTPATANSGGFAYDTNYLFGYAEYASSVTTANILTSDPSCSLEPNPGTNTLNATKPLCPSSVTMRWVDRKKLYLLTNVEPSQTVTNSGLYGSCTMGVQVGTEAEIVSSRLDCSSVYTFTYTGSLDLDTKSIAVIYRFYAQNVSESADANNDVVCRTTSAQTFTVAQYACTDALTVTAATGNSKYTFGITNFALGDVNPMGSCRLLATCNSASGEKSLDFPISCASAFDIEFYEISDLFSAQFTSGSLFTGDVCTFTYQYRAASDSDWSNPICRSSSVQKNIVPPDCVDSLARSSTVQTSYTPLGLFTLSVTNPPAAIAGFNCRVRLTKWAGTSLTDLQHSVSACSNAAIMTSPATFFLHGSIYEYVVEQFTSTGYGSLKCRSTSPTQVLPTTCKNGGAATSLSLLQLPFGRVKTIIANAPSTDMKCAMFIHYWNGAVLDQVATSLIACDSAFVEVTNPNSDWITSGKLAISMMRYDTSIVSTAPGWYLSQPICGVNPVEITTSVCTDTPTVSVPNWQTVSLVFSPAVSSSYTLVLYTEEWDYDLYSNKSSLLTFSKTVTDRTNGTVTSTDLGYSPIQFHYDSVYKFSYSQFNSGANIATAQPVCSRSGIVTSAPVPTCNGTLAFARTDGESVRATLTGHSVLYGVCKIFITRITPSGGSPQQVSNIVSTTSADFGCAGFNYEFSSVALSLDLTDATEVDFKYQFYADKTDIDDSNPTCTSTTMSYTIPHYDIGTFVQTTTSTSTGNLYSFSVTSAPSAHGTCYLTISCNVVGVTQSATVPIFPCSAGYPNKTFMNLSNLLGYVYSGTSCSTSWDYFTAYRTKGNGFQAYTSLTAADPIVLDAPICKTNGLVTTTVDANYLYDGSFVFTIANPPDTSSPYSCRVAILIFAGTAYYSKYIEGCADGKVMTESDLFGSTTVRSFTYGTLYKFAVQRYDTSDPELLFCQSSPATTVTPLDSSSGSPVSIVKYPFDQVWTYVAAPPTGYTKCVFYLTKWAGNFVSLQSTSTVDCSTGTYWHQNSTSVAFAYGQQYSVRAAFYSTSTSVTSSQPYSGSNVVSITPTGCTNPVSYENPDYNVLRSYIGDSSFSSEYCYYFVSKWNNDVLIPNPWLSISKKISIGCGSVDIYGGTDLDVPHAFTFGTEFQVEYAEYNTQPSDYSKTNPTCSKSSNVYTLPSFDCPVLKSDSSGENFVVQRHDVQTVKVTIPEPPDLYGKFSMELISYNGGPPDSGTSTVGPQDCNTEFVFTYNSAQSTTITYDENHTVQFAYHWYPDVNNLSFEYCSGIQPSTVQLGPIVCHPMSISYTAPDYVYTFVFSKLPYGGKCVVHFTCDSGSKTGSMLIPDCSVITGASLNELTANMDDPLTMALAAGSRCTFTYDYTTTTPAKKTCTSDPTSATTLQATSNACKGSNNAASVVDVTYRGTGQLHVAISNAPVISGSLCRVMVSRWSGEYVADDFTTCATGGADTILTKPSSVIGPALFFGQEYTVMVQYINPNRTVQRYCDSASITIVPALCESAPNEPIDFKLVSYPFGAVKAVLAATPYTSGYCVFYLQQWAGNSSSYTTSPQSCDFAPLVDPEQDYLSEHLYSAMMIQYPGTDTTVEPQCGLNPVDVLPHMCSSSYFPMITTPGNSIIQVSLPPTSAPPSGLDCIYYVYKWSGTVIGSPNQVYWKRSSNCAAAQFSAGDVGGNAVTYGQEFGFAFSLIMPTADSYSGHITCMSSGATFGFVLDPKCGIGKLQYNRIDPNSVRIKIANPLSSPAECLIKIVREGNTVGTTAALPQPLTKRDLCSANFDFSDPSGVHFNDGKVISVEFEVYASSTSQAPLCSSNPQPEASPQLSNATLQTFQTCPILTSAAVGTSTYPQYRFSMTDGMYTGTCVLQVDCTKTGGATYYTIEAGSGWSGCRNPYTIDFAAVSRAIGSSPNIGQTCNFRYKYFAVGLGLNDPATCTSNAILSAPINARTCTTSSGGSTLTYLTATYTDMGAFKVTVNSPPDLSGLSGASCRLYMTQWASSTSNALSMVNSDNSCSQFEITGPDFAFGKDYSFQIGVEETDGTIYCQGSSGLTVTPPLCLGSDFGLSTVKLVKLPRGRVQAYLANAPQGLVCKFYLESWAGAAASTVQTATSSCSVGTIFDNGGFSYSGGYKVREVSFVDSTTTATSCGTAPTQQTFNTCPGTLVARVSSVGSVEVSFPGEMGSGSKCVVYLNKWGDADMVSLGYFITSPGCVPVTFRSIDFGGTFAFDKQYAFEYAKFKSSDNILIANPVCSNAQSVFTFPSPVCGDGFMYITRPDPVSIAVSLGSHAPTYGLCQFTLRSSISATSSVVKTGSCSDTYVFQSVTNVVALDNGATVSLSYAFYPTGDFTATTTCTGTQNTLLIPTFDTCSSLSVRTNPVGTYNFAISSPIPTVGECSLYLVGFDSTTITWGKCDVPLSLNYAALVSVLGNGLTLGSTMSFYYKYTLNGAPICTAETLVNVAQAELAVSVNQIPRDTSSVKLSATVPSQLSSAVPNLQCEWSFAGCNGVSTYATTNENTTCTDQPVFASHIDSGVPCRFQLKVYDESSSALVGESGTLTFIAIGPPAWTSPSSLMVSSGGTTGCLFTSWRVPDTNGGYPVTCYLVESATGSGGSLSFSLIRSCISPDKLKLTMTVCNLSTTEIYNFRVTAITNIGQASIETTGVSLGDMLAVPYSVYTGTVPATAIAGAFPTISIMSKINAQTSDSSITRLFISQLQNRGSLVESDTNFQPEYSGGSLVGPLPLEAPPAFTQAYSASAFVTGQYDCYANQQTSGSYTFITYTAEAGGLWGSYWSGKSASVSAALVGRRKDPIIDFKWSRTSALYGSLLQELFARWNGFIEAEFSETYSFKVIGNVPLKLVINNDVLIDTLTRGSCVGGCIGTIPLTASDRSYMTTRVFNSIRLDVREDAKSVTQSYLTLLWSSPSTSLSPIPTDRLFTAQPIALDTNGASNSARDIRITAGELSPSDTTVTFPASVIASTYVAGLPYRISVISRDGYGNRRENSDGFADQFSLTVTNATDNSVEQTLLSVTGSQAGDNYFTLINPTIGSFQFSFLSTADSSSIGSSPYSISVVNGAPVSVPSDDINMISSSPYIAGSEIRIGFIVRDVTGNAVTASDPRVSIALMTVTATWNGDTSTPALIGNYDDSSARATRFKTTVSPKKISWDSGLQKFQGTFVLSLAGSYDVSVRYGQSTASVKSNLLILEAERVADGRNSVVVAISPVGLTRQALALSRPTLTMDTTYTFTIQLRDKYGNGITAAVTPSEASVYIAHSKGTCVAGSTAGQYDCTIAPSIPRASGYLSITIGNSLVSVVTDTPSLVAGPWPISVKSGQASRTETTVAAMQTAYIQSVPVKTRLILRDRDRNVMPDVPSGSTYIVSGQFTDPTNVGPQFTMPASTVSLDTDGYLKFDFVCPSLFYNYEMALTISFDNGGTFASMGTANVPYRVNCLIGPVSTSNSLCTGYPQTATQGGSLQGSCTLKDAAANSITTGTSVVQTYFASNSAPSSVTVLPHSFSNGVYDVSRTWPTTDGYSLYTVAGVQGGLLQSLYSDNSFTTRISGPSDVSDTILGVTYNAITSSFNVISTGKYQYAGTGGVESVLSYKWEGLIKPDATATYTIRVQFRGAMEIVLSDPTDFLNIPQTTISGPDDNTNNLQIVTQTVILIANRARRIKITYVPSTDTYFGISWSYNGGTTPNLYIGIPANVLQAPLAFDQRTVSAR